MNNAKNMNDPISDALATIWEGLIEDFQVNLFEGQLSFSISVYEADDAIGHHQLIFDGVSSFCFFNGPDNRRFKFVSSEKLEISEIYYFADPINHLDNRCDKKGTPRYHADANFYMEIWEAPLFIEAQALILDGVRYEVTR